jgi:hypothetical protein
MFINEPSHYDESLDRTGRTIDQERGVSLVRLSGGGERPDLFALLIGDRRIAFEAEWEGDFNEDIIEWNVKDIGLNCIWFGTVKGETKKIGTYRFRDIDEYLEITRLIDESLRAYTMRHGTNPIPVSKVILPNSTTRLKT